MNLNNKRSQNIYLFGVGKSNIYDTYLSPLEYKGLNLVYLYKHNKQSKLFNRSFIVQQNALFEFSNTKSPVKNVSSIFFRLKYEFGGHYNLFQCNKIKIKGGALTSFSVGGLYNNRNGNNPATAKMAINILPSLITTYEINGKVQLNLQANTNLIGCYFQLPYGESYYEFSKGNTKESLNLSSPFNIRLLDILFYNNIKVNQKNFLIGMGIYLQQTKIHDINTHNYNYDFILGLSF